MRAWHVFGYWLTVYSRTWRGTIVISVANPVLFLLGIGVGLGHLVDQGRAGWQRIGIFDGNGRAQDIVRGHPPRVARKLVAAARSAHAAQNTAANERLQNGLKMPRR